jgi:acetyl-CoA carboxylase biotin carboxylase subunit
VTAGFTVPVFYDSMIAKLVAWGGSRDEAIGRMARALEEYQVLGIRTTIPFFVWLMKQSDYRSGIYDTTWLDRLMEGRQGQSFNELDEFDTRMVAIAAAIDAAMSARVNRSAVEASPDSVWRRAARIEGLRS